MKLMIFFYKMDDYCIHNVAFGYILCEVCNPVEPFRILAVVDGNIAVCFHNNLAFECARCDEEIARFVRSEWLLCREEFEE